MQKSPEVKNLMAALVLFQAEVATVKKGAVNPFFKSKYADLASIIEAVRTPLAKHGLAFSQFPAGEYGLTTLLVHSSGEYMEETFTMRPVDAKPQSLGSAITYARRYALGAVLGIATEEDDDGNEASQTYRQDAPVRAQRAPQRAQPVQGDIDYIPVINDDTGLACTYPECYAPITQAEKEYSTKLYGQPLCRTHQAKAKAGK